MAIRLANDIQCVGCMACLGVCSQNCIKCVADTEGFYYPAVDNAACINCGLCKEVCPVLSDFDLSDYIKKSYYGKSKNKEVLKESTSGGIFYHLAESCLQSGGNVYGAFFDTDSMTLKCDSSDRVGLENLMKSKYIESSMGSIIKEIKKELLNGRKVLFSGTPCEAAGIRKVFKNNENLIIVDFICHGVPSSKLFKEHLLKIKPRGALKEIMFFMSLPAKR